MNATIGTRDDWLAARKALLAEEKAFTKAREALAEKRRALPRYKVEKSYTFTTPQGPQSLGDLFGNKSQLIIYHFMFGKDWEQGCKSCSFWADNFNGITDHLAQRDVAFASVSIAPLAKLTAFQKRMSWTFNWVSSEGSGFNQDFGVSPQPGKPLIYNFDRMIEDAGEMPGVSVFAKDDHGDVYHTYSCFARGLDMLNGAYQFLDLAPKGRDEAGLPFTMSWVKHRDRYDAAS